MNNCKETDKKLRELGWDGVYDLIQEQRKEIDRMRTVLVLMIGQYKGESRMALNKILFGEGEIDD